MLPGPGATFLLRVPAHSREHSSLLGHPSDRVRRICLVFSCKARLCQSFPSWKGRRRIISNDCKFDPYPKIFTTCRLKALHFLAWSFNYFDRCRVSQHILLTQEVSYHAPSQYSSSPWTWNHASKNVLLFKSYAKIFSLLEEIISLNKFWNHCTT